MAEIIPGDHRRGSLCEDWVASDRYLGGAHPDADLNSKQEVGREVWKLGIEVRKAIPGTAHPLSKYTDMWYSMVHT